MTIPDTRPVATEAADHPKERIPAALKANGNSSNRRTYRVARWIHVYASMLALLLVLFFSLTGITLNHPDFFEGSSSTSTSTGTLPFTPTSNGDVKWLDVAEYVRSSKGVSGHVTNYSVSGTTGVLEFRKPGYVADVQFDTGTAKFQVRVEQQGLVAVLDDLHKGRDSSPGWNWTIDVVAGFLAVVSLTGLLMQFFLRKRRRSAYIIAGVGLVVGVVLMFLGVA